MRIHPDGSVSESVELCVVEIQPTTGEVIRISMGWTMVYPDIKEHYERLAQQDERRWVILRRVTEVRTLLKPE